MCRLFLHKETKNDLRPHVLSFPAPFEEFIFHRQIFVSFFFTSSLFLPCCFLGFYKSRLVKGFFLFFFQTFKKTKNMSGNPAQGQPPTQTIPQVSEY